MFLRNHDAVFHSNLTVLDKNRSFHIFITFKALKNKIYFRKAGCNELDVA